MALLLAAAFAGLLFLFRRLIRRRTGTAFAGGRWQQKALSTVVLLAVTAALLLPIRGGFQLAPLNQSSVYFSRYHFANQAAVNACWNFMHSLLNKGASNTNPYSYFEDTVARRVADSLYRPGPGSLPQLLRTRRPNVVLVIWESFTAKAVDSTWKGKEVTPYFNALKKEGIYFSNVFASGDRTDKGLTAILSGYPALPNGSIIHVPAKSGRLHNLGRLLKDSGYAASFYYGGAPEFGNFKSYFLQNGFDPIITEEDFSGKDRNSKWGAHDGVVAGRIIRDLATARTPFFTGWLTLSSHEPFEIPEAPLFPGSELADRFYSSLHYTDKALQQLVRYCARQPWWNETVMIIIADHGHPQPPREDRAENFRIPMLWLGGALTQRGLTVDRILSQVDFATTFTRQLGYPEGLFPYSRNAFDRTAQPWAFFSFNNGFGFQQPGSTLLYDHVGKTVIRSSGNAGAAQVRAGQALQQVFFRDYLQK
jgi:phosphoglycerol transferase MdoB-like AlkP superfamily enzyme